MVLKCTSLIVLSTFLYHINETVSYLEHFQNFLQTLITETEFNKAQYERRNSHFAFYLRTSPQHST